MSRTSELTGFPKRAKSSGPTISLLLSPAPDGKLIQAKYFAQVRDDAERKGRSMSQLKLKADRVEDY